MNLRLDIKILKLWPKLVDHYRSKDLLERQGYDVEDHKLTSRQQADDFKAKHDVKTGVFQVSCRIKLNFMPPALLLFSLDLNLLH